MKKLRIGVDATPLIHRKTGVGNYIYYYLEELVALRSDCQFYLFSPIDSQDLQYFARFSNVQICTDKRLSNQLTVWGQTILPWHLFRLKIDVFWATIQYCPLIKSRRMKILFTLHDFVYLLYPEMLSTKWWRIPQILIPFMLRRVDYILPNSYGTANRLKEYYDLDYSAVIEPPIKPWLKPIHAEKLNPWLATKNLRYKEYLLAIGTLEPRKNFESVLKAFEVAMEKNETSSVLPLVIMGGIGWKSSHLTELLAMLKKKYPNHLIVTGYTDEDEQWHYLAGAKFLVMLSHYEGYGMPIAEARACGTDVICTDSPEMREAALEEGIFLKTNEVNQKLPSFFLADAKIEISRSRNDYQTNRKKIEKMSIFLDKIRNDKKQIKSK